MSVEEVLRTMSVEDAGYGDFSKLDSDEDKGKQFQDLVIKFSNLRTLLEPGAGRFGETAQNDIRHKIGRFMYIERIIVYQHHLISLILKHSHSILSICLEPRHSVFTQMAINTCRFV